MKRKIDVGGLSQFYTGRKELSPTMQLEYTLKEAVDIITDSYDRISDLLKECLDGR